MWSIVPELAGASSGELVAAAEAIAGELAGRAGPESGVVAMELAEGLARCIDVSEAALATLVGRVDATGAHGESGFPSAVAWLREAVGMRQGRASERVALARQLPRLERVAKLLSGSGLSFGFASAIAGAVPRLDDEDTSVAQDILLGMVQEGCSVGQVAKAGDRITDLVAERQGRQVEPEDSKRGFARSWLTRSKSLDGGTWIKGWCNPEHTAAFDQIIGTLAKPRAQGDDRDLAQRTADALFSVITEGNKSAGVTVIIDLAAYTTATGDTGPFNHTPRTTLHPDPHPDPQPDPHPDPRSGPGSGEQDTLGGALSGTNEDHVEAMEPFVTTLTEPAASRAPGRGRVPARLLDGTPISPQDARRIALNAGINALLLGPQGQPLDLGRTVRFATAAQRKTLLAIYDTCSVHGCQIPSHLCEIHHTNGGWKLGTPTDINQLTPLCGWHNRWIETHPDQITQTKDKRGRFVLKIRPLWQTQRGTLQADQVNRETSSRTQEPGAP